MIFLNSPGDADYTGVFQTITFLASETMRSVSVPITNDDVYELDETFTATISEVMDNPNVDITLETTTVTINDDDSKS